MNSTRFYCIHLAHNGGLSPQQAVWNSKHFVLRSVYYHTIMLLPTSQSAIICGIVYMSFCELLQICPSNLYNYFQRIIILKR